MAKVKLELGAEIDILNASEFRKESESSQASWFRELARGLKVIRFPWPLQAAVSAGAVVIGGQQVDGPQCGPREGFVWMVQRVSVLGDVTADVVSLWRGDSSSSQNFVANIPLTTGYFSPGSKSLLLHPGEELTITGTGLQSSKISMTGEAIEAPGPMIWKLL